MIVFLNGNIFLLNETKYMYMAYDVDIKKEHEKISRSQFHLLFKNGAILAYWTASNFADMPYILLHMKVVLPCPSDKYSMILNLGLLRAF